MRACRKVRERWSKLSAACRVGGLALSPIEVAQLHFTYTAMSLVCVFWWFTDNLTNAVRDGSSYSLFISPTRANAEADAAFYRTRKILRLNVRKHRRAQRGIVSEDFPSSLTSSFLSLLLPPLVSLLHTMILSQIAWVDCFAFLIFLAPQLIIHVGLIKTAITGIKALPFLGMISIIQSNNLFKQRLTT